MYTHICAYIYCMYIHTHVHMYGVLPALEAVTPDFPDADMREDLLTDVTLVPAG